MVNHKKKGGKGRRSTNTNSGSNNANTGNTNTNNTSTNNTNNSTFNGNNGNNVFVHQGVLGQAPMPRSSIEFSKDYTKATILTWCVHHQNVKEEQEWLIAGLNNMNPEFLDEMYRRVMSEDDYRRFRIIGGLPDARQLATWMLANRELEMERISAEIQYHLALLRRQEEDAKSKKPFDDKSTGPGGNGEAPGSETFAH